MITKFKLPGRLILYLSLLAVYALGGPAYAVLELTLSDDVATERIQWYWGGDARNAATDGRMINPDPMISFDLSDANRQAKPASAAPPTNMYVFGANDSYPNSKKTYVRIWEEDAKTNGSKYTNLHDWDNPTGGIANPSLTINYTKIYDKPARPVIIEVVESITTPLGVSGDVVVASGASSGSVTIKSQGTSHDSGLGVDVVQRQWEVNGAAGPSGTNLVLDSASYPMDEGTTYTVRVRYQGVNSQWSDYSAPYTYVVGGGMAGPGGPMSIVFNLLSAQTDKLVVNTIFIPSTNLTQPEITTVSVASDLARVVNNVAGANVVAAVSRWNRETGQPEVALFDADGNLISGSPDFSLSLSEAYQIYTSQDVDITLGTGAAQ
jgi:hypothetical protein